MYKKIRKALGWIWYVIWLPVAILVTPVVAVGALTFEDNWEDFKYQIQSLYMR